jgi:hypothetical protein
MCSLQTIKAKCGVPCNNKPLLWFFAKKAPTIGVICYFLFYRGRIIIVTP